MDEILHHFATMGSHCLLDFTGASNFVEWREMDFATIHMGSGQHYPRFTQAGSMPRAPIASFFLFFFFPPPTLGAAGRQRYEGGAGPRGENGRKSSEVSEGIPRICGGSCVCVCVCVCACFFFLFFFFCLFVLFKNKNA